MNILLTSAGRRNLIVQYFKQSFTVFAGDCSNTAPALYDADHTVILPRIDDPEYIEKLIQICKQNNIQAVLALIDPELSLLAKNKDKFEQSNIKCIISDYDKVEICFDKFELFKFLKQNNIPTIPTFNSIDDALTAIANKELNFPLMVKPAKGSASMGLNIVNNEEELRTAFAKEDIPIIQEFIDGQEYGIDTYVDLISKQVINIFPKKKIKMRSGETDKAVSEKNQEIINIVKTTIEKLNLIGPIDMDGFMTEKGFLVSEINPRFGGGYPLAFECGVDFMKMLLNNLNNQQNTPDIGNFVENRYMFKYDRVCIKDQNQLK